ncbi:MAG: dTDP-4-dehydrorhamnose 3,5-epimerase [Alphaproteobacteria bacterium]
MKFYKTEIPGVFIIEPKKFGDERGYFFESYNKKEFYDNGIKNNFIQDNQSFSKYGTIRGLHFQTGKSAQAKLVRAVQGQVLDVAVDLRKASPTFGKHVAVLLNDQENNMLLVPRGFAHGFSVQSETTVFAYKCDNLYNASSEGGIIYNDPNLNIDWKIPADKFIISGKDTLWPTLAQWRSKGAR